MPISLDIGTINIRNQDIVNFIQHKSIEEIKTLFLNLLSKEIKTNQTDKQHKWAQFGDKMSGLIDEKSYQELREGSREFREDFSFRNLKV